MIWNAIKDNLSLKRISCCFILPCVYFSIKSPILAVKRPNSTQSCWPRTGRCSSSPCPENPRWTCRCSSGCSGKGYVQPWERNISYNFFYKKSVPLEKPWRHKWILSSKSQRCCWQWRGRPRAAARTPSCSCGSCFPGQIFVGFVDDMFVQEKYQF